MTELTLEQPSCGCELLDAMPSPERATAVEAILSERGRKFRGTHALHAGFDIWLHHYDTACRRPGRPNQGRRRIESANSFVCHKD